MPLSFLQLLIERVEHFTIGERFTSFDITIGREIIRFLSHKKSSSTHNRNAYGASCPIWQLGGLMCGNQKDPSIFLFSINFYG